MLNQPSSTNQRDCQCKGVKLGFRCPEKKTTFKAKNPEYYNDRCKDAPPELPVHHRFHALFALDQIFQCSS